MALDGPSEHANGEPCRKWYNAVHSTPPYQLETITHEGHNHPDELHRWDCAQFWPLVGALKPWRDPEGEVGWDWDEFEGTVALCGMNKLIIGQCTNEHAWSVLSDIQIGKEDTAKLYSVAWTYHPFTCHPLVAVGGKTGLICIIDVLTKEVLRVLKGHGDAVNYLTFAPHHPHILASSSADRTTRVWNILGADAPHNIPIEELSQNYPMADADEGTCVVAVIAGEGKGGHQSYVVHCEFHPSKRAIATCGMDYKVKIWALPPFPDPYPMSLPTPRGYRPKVLHFPIFSTSRLVAGFLDWVGWISDDILVVRSGKAVVTWQWLSYPRYFREDEFAALGTDPSYGDYSESGSFMTIARYDIGQEQWFRNIAHHRGFHPHPEDLSRFPPDKMVTETLIACASHVEEDFVAMSQNGEEKRVRNPGSIHMFNPCLAKEANGKPPEPYVTLRPRTPELFRSGHSRKYMVPEEDIEGDLDYDSGFTDNPSLSTWLLQPATMTEPADVDKWSRQNHEYVGLLNVAISPRGAKWVVGVGSGLSLFVWKIKDSDNL
ncbi:hypothetical protein L198_03062 [Cryptococcus wingfieldii CBS 7118]|uniref:Polycomb protein EED n=1 Tax=Cryptococcus wingfieldii CBS 7118 TaxID=1295528 RepID=A0A1E3JJC3_9TREE|nr:hypothetical protein L198_03062 [Cryptococcus wingfieldii CBS 7118]ODO00736.1 hypothetical protein L198_03062 [Cryptococcus wingfieldii CBS 7118]